MKSRKITTKEVLRQTGIKSGKTLTRWYQDGLIPQPDIGTQPTGRGRTAYWPHWVVGRCQAIRGMLKDGKTLTEIAKLLGTDWAAEEAKSSKRRGDYDFATISKLLRHHECISRFTDRALDVLLSSIVKSQTEYPVVLRTLMRQLDRPMVEKSLELVRSGHSPVFIFDGACLDVVPDFMLTHLLAAGQPLFVIPIFKEVVNAFSPSVSNLPTEPTIKPIMTVRSKDGETVQEFDVVPVGERDFELVQKGSPEGSVDVTADNCAPSPTKPSDL
jgi:hypothetical protein